METCKNLIVLNNTITFRSHMLMCFWEVEQNSYYSYVAPTSFRTLEAFFLEPKGCWTDAVVGFRWTQEGWWKLRHLADARQWKKFDEKYYMEFGKDSRNVSFLGCTSQFDAISKHMPIFSFYHKIFKTKKDNFILMLKSNISYKFCIYDPNLRSIS